MIDEKEFPHCAEAFQYASDVLEKKILVCKYIQLACKRHFNDLKNKKLPFVFNQAEAERVCKFMELLPHVKGEWARKRQLIKLGPWQKFILCSIFGWQKEDGTRRFTEIYLEVSRKNAKSTLASGIALYMFALDNEYGAEVYSGATTQNQAWEVFRPAKQMVERTPDFTSRFKIEVMASNLSIPSNGSRFEPVIGKPGDGASPSCAIIDEYHEHKTSELYDTMVTGMGARKQPLTVIITTAGSNMSSPCYDKRNQVLKMLNNTISNQHLFGMVYTIDEEDDWSSDIALKKANPNLGVSISLDYLASRRQEALNIASRQNIFKTKHLNIWVGAMSAWMNMALWSKCPSRKPLEDLKGRKCILALDLASKCDVAPIIMLFLPTEEDPLWHVHAKYYLPEDVVVDHRADTHSHFDTWAKMGLITLTPGNITDQDYIMDDIRDIASEFDVLDVAYDPWQATYLATKLMGEGLPMIEVRQTVQNFSEPMKELEALVMSKKLAHGNCPVLTWMISNVVAKLDKKDNIFPNKEKPENKIDGVVALIMALARAINHNHEESIYESRGIRTI